MNQPIHPRRRPISRGVTMIEILIALVITVFGLFAMLGLNLRSYQAESESYQRSQALVLVEDMAQRIRANRSAVADYATPAATAAGAGTTLEACGAGVSAANDICEWGNLLRGAAETAAGGTNIGAMTDAQGCITVAAPAGGASGPTSANVVVVWRGTVASATNAAAPCVPAGFGVTDGFMRFTSTIVRLGDLDGI
jgi:type IV pilus assembly protein PilV